MTSTSEPERPIGADPARARLSAVLFNTTARGGHHGCTVVCAQIDYLAREAGISVDLQLGLDLSEAPHSLERYDLVLVNGEGSLHHDGGTAHKIAAIARHCAAIGRPAFLINSVYEANGPEIAAGVAEFCRRWTRDRASAAEMRAAGLSCETIPDLSLTWSPDVVSPARDGIVVTDSVLKDVAKDLWALSRDLHAPYVPLKTVPPLLPRHPGSNARRRNRWLWRRRLVHLLPSGPMRSAYADVVPDLTDFARVLAKSSLLVTGRFHAVTLAMDLELPFLAISSNTGKIEGLMAMVGIEGRVFRSVADLTQRLRTDGPAAFALTEAERTAIREHRRETLAAARDMFARIASITRG